MQQNKFLHRDIPPSGRQREKKREGGTDSDGFECGMHRERERERETCII